MIEIKKRVLAKIPKCYSVMNMLVHGEIHLFFASEQPNVGCYEFYGEDFKQHRMVWQKPGGCMSMIPHPYQANTFLAIREFYLNDSNNQAELVWLSYRKNRWEERVLLKLPYLHRFDVYEKAGKCYIVAATIATNKQNKEDWSSPGCIYGGVLSDDWNDPLHLEKIVDDCYRNHGYWRDQAGDGGYFACDAGLIHLKLPTQNQDWQYEYLLRKPLSECAIIDDDLITIEPFHGNQICLYKNEPNGYQQEMVVQEGVDFAHALYAGKLYDKPMFLAGYRGGDQSLLMIIKNHKGYEMQILDQQVGPANVAVLENDSNIFIMSANRTLGEAVLYQLL